MARSEACGLTHRLCIDRRGARGGQPADKANPLGADEGAFQKGSRCGGGAALGHDMASLPRHEPSVPRFQTFQECPADLPGHFLGRPLLAHARKPFIGPVAHAEEGVGGDLEVAGSEQAFFDALFDRL